MNENSQNGCHVIQRLRETPGVVVPLVMLATVVALLLTVGMPNTAAAQQTASRLCADGVAVADPANNPGLLSDCDTLLTARDTLAGSGSLDWSAGTPIGQWDGVTVSGSPLRVTKLVLVSWRLSGEIPAELGDLTNLLELDLSFNELSGAIPGELGSLTPLWFLSSGLQSLDLSSNQLSGEIPPEFGLLTSLQTLDLSSNELSGEIPTELGSLTLLEALYLSGNQLSGEIPGELGSLTLLEALYLSGNQLSGCIPEGLRDVADNDLDALGLPFCVSRSVSEGAEAGSNVGDPVVATGDDGGGTWTYTLGGADAGLFDIDSGTGQITVGAGTMLDYEDPNNADHEYEVTVTATDPSDASDTIRVTIMVTDVRVSDDPVVNGYDANTNEMIDKGEILQAVRDYFNGEIDKAAILELIGLYFDQ